VKARWIALLIVLVAAVPKQVTAFCQQVVTAAMSVFNNLTSAH
jgi:hypothetical protein